jgi:hypothetical protein
VPSTRGQRRVRHSLPAEASFAFSDGRALEPVRADGLVQGFLEATQISRRSATAEREPQLQRNQSKESKKERKQERKARNHADDYPEAESDGLRQSLRPAARDEWPLSLWAHGPDPSAYGSRSTSRSTPGCQCRLRRRVPRAVSPAGHKRVR